MRDEGRSDPPPSATRDHLANERTLLAWVRTSVAIMGLGFVVARFGLLLRELAHVGVRQTPSGVSTGIGVTLVVLGAIMLGFAYLRYRQVASDIQHNRVSQSPIMASVVAGTLVVAGIVLAVYLILTG